MLKLKLMTAAAIGALMAGAAPAAGPKNVIIMIADGAGYNTLQAARLWSGVNSVNGTLAVDNSAFRSMAISTYPLSTRTIPLPGAAGLAQDPDAVYDPAKNWDTDPVAGSTGGYANGFDGYQWNRRNAPDSANTIVGLMTGQKTYNNAVNVNGNGDPLLTFAEVSERAGKSVGVVSTVQFSDATPSVGGGAHNVTRANRTAVAHEMFTAGTLSVIGGAGNPDYTNDGVLRTAADYSWVTAADWAALKAGTLTNNQGEAWTLTQERSTIQALANGTATQVGNLAMISKSFDGNDQYRGGLVANNVDAFATPLRTDVPNLSELAIAALNHMGTDSDGLYLLAEEGEVDRAMHSNNIGRMIEAYLEFNASVQAVMNWIDRADTAADWSNTLLIVSADHDHLLFGPDGATNPFQSVLADGLDAGLNPDHAWLGNGHSNQLVPFFVRGAGADDIFALADDIDFYKDALGRTFGRGRYTDQAEVGRYLLASAVPEPGTWAMLIGGFGLIGATLRRRASVVGRAIA